MTEGTKSPGTTGHVTPKKQASAPHANGQRVDELHIDGQHANGQHANGQHANGRHPHDAETQHAETQHEVDAHRRAAVSSGNPRITVAFPFSRIDIKEPSEAVRELAALVEQLAEQAVTFARQAAPDHADEADRLAAQATLLAHRLAV
jgi:hypothetical protein